MRRGHVKPPAQQRPPASGRCVSRDVKRGGAYGLSLLWLLVPLSAKQPWTAWAVLTVTLTALLPVLYVTASVRRLAPSARTPIIPAAIVLALAVSGASVSLF